MYHFHELKLSSKQPVYIQIALYVKRQILLGAVESGERLPSRRDVAVQLNVNPNTVQKAYKLMEDEGYVRTMGNQGSVIYTDEQLISRIEEELTSELVQDFIASVKEIRLNYRNVIELISKHWDE
ncbi:GntR family transcriptional regulator [Paenibacillus chungangensis]|uniref:GntR family transcriptional regulator n=1 Tax=Paenibacillus chungangensis TaxID=696535 RepID=A0ABW3HTA3_9BACL